MYSVKQKLNSLWDRNKSPVLVKETLNLEFVGFL